MVVRSDKNRNTVPWISAPWISGVLGGAGSTILLYPLGLVKVRLQVNEDPTGNQKGAQLTQQRRTIVSTIRGVIRHEGVAGLYQGLTPALLGSALSWGGYFYLYEGIKLRLIEEKRRKANIIDSSDRTDDDTKLVFSENFTCSCMAGAALVVCTNPIWLIKTRMQLQMTRVLEVKAGKAANGSPKDAIKPPYKNIVDAARTIVREEGPLALYKGAAPAMMLISHGGVQFGTYEYLKTHFGTYTKAKRSTGTNNSGIGHQLQDSIGYLTMGAVSKIIASTATYPLQVIKSRLQQRSQAAELSASGEVKIVKREYAGVIDCVARIWKREGTRGFFKGCIPNVIRVTPNAAITLVVYESAMNFLS